MTIDPTMWIGASPGTATLSGQTPNLDAEFEQLISLTLANWTLPIGEVAFSEPNAQSNILDSATKPEDSMVAMGMAGQGNVVPIFPGTQPELGLDFGKSQLEKLPDSVPTLPVAALSTVMMQGKSVLTLSPKLSFAHQDLEVLAPNFAPDGSAPVSRTAEPEQRQVLPKEHKPEGAKVDAMIPQQGAPNLTSMNSATTIEASSTVDLTTTSVPGPIAAQTEVTHSKGGVAIQSFARPESIPSQILDTLTQDLNLTQMTISQPQPDWNETQQLERELDPLARLVQQAGLVKDDVTLKPPRGTSTLPVSFRPEASALLFSSTTEPIQIDPQQTVKAAGRAEVISRTEISQSPEIQTTVLPSVGQSPMPEVEAPKPTIQTQLTNPMVSPTSAHQETVSPASVLLGNASPSSALNESEVSEAELKIESKVDSPAATDDLPLQEMNFAPTESKRVSEVRESGQVIQPREIQEQVIDRIRKIEEMRPPMSLKMILEPEKLGSITIQLRQSEGRVDAQITASNSQVHHALSQAKQELIQAFDAKGMPLGSFDLQQQNAQQGQQTPREDFERHVNMMKANINSNSQPAEILVPRSYVDQLDVRT